MQNSFLSWTPCTSNTPLWFGFLPLEPGSSWVAGGDVRVAHEGSQPFVEVASCHLSVWYLSKEEEAFLWHKPLHITWFLNRARAGAKPPCVGYMFGPVEPQALRPTARQVTCLSGWQRSCWDTSPDSGKGHLLPRPCPGSAALPVGMPVRRITSTERLEKNSHASKSGCQSCVRLLENICYRLKFVCTPLVPLYARRFLLIQQSTSKTKKCWCSEQVLQLP